LEKKLPLNGYKAEKILIKLKKNEYRFVLYSAIRELGEDSAIWNFESVMVYEPKSEGNMLFKRKLESAVV
jgi:hypothetical protein